MGLDSAGGSVGGGKFGVGSITAASEVGAVGIGWGLITVGPTLPVGEGVGAAVTPQADSSSPRIHGSRRIDKGKTENILERDMINWYATTGLNSQILCASPMTCHKDQSVVSSVR